MLDEPKESFLEVQIEATLGGRDLSTFEEVIDTHPAGYQATCRNCGQTVWVGKNGVIYSLLDDECLSIFD